MTTPSPPPQPSTSSPAGAEVPSFPVVGIGASAGGLAAFEAFFAAMPADHATGLAFVLVQHLSPDHKSILAELVRRYTTLQVMEASDGLAVRPDSVYIIPPGHDLRIDGSTLRLAPHTPGHKPQLTIDRFFASLAASQRDKAIGIVLSGTGSDGTLGLREIKGEGGMVMVQSPDSTEHDGMPRSAIATGLVDFVVPPGRMPAHLIAYVRHAFNPAARDEAPTLGDDALGRLCQLLRAHTGHDFSQYKPATLVRRMARRMALHQIEPAEAYLRYAREHPAEIDALFRDLLIGVTQFFRDPDAFTTLEESVLRPLLAAKPAHEPLRVWVCSCSTGEEAYSIAMLLYEQINRERQPLKLQIFATDIDRRAIEQARSGVYPASIAAHVSEERLTRFFTHDPQRGTYRIQKHIRDLLVFSEQDVIKDPPFSRLDLVSCRNLMIYLNADLQRRLVPLFHYALLPGGALFLGTAETVGEHTRLFEPVDRKWKIYRRQPGPQDSRPELPGRMPGSAGATTGRRVHPPAPHAFGGDPAQNLRQLTERALLAHYVQAAVLVNGLGRMLHIVGRTGKFFEPADGDPSMNVLTMGREGLKRELTIALHKAVAHKQPVRYPGLRVKTNGDYSLVDLAVSPVEAADGSPVFLVVLEERAEPVAPPIPSPDESGAESRLVQLERELRAKDEYLQTALEEMETTHEELKSTNEEMQSINEELQSTNEELETSKEELQSVNEELSTVNAELQDRVNQLSHANNDMNNLLAGTGVGTVFVDHALHIARFTPAATRAIPLIPSDIGRPLAHVAVNLVGYDRLADDLRAVIETLVPIEAEVQTRDGTWFLMRLGPYRTTENLVEGAVITLVDISARRRAEDSLGGSLVRLGELMDHGYTGVAELGLDGRVLFANERLCQALGYSRDELLTKHLADVTEPDDLPRMQAAFEALAAGTPAMQLPRRYRRKDGSSVAMQERLSALRDRNGRTTSLLALCFEPTS